MGLGFHARAPERSRAQHAWVQAVRLDQFLTSIHLILAYLGSGSASGPTFTTFGLGLSCPSQTYVFGVMHVLKPTFTSYRPGLSHPSQTCLGPSSAPEPIFIFNGFWHLVRAQHSPKKFSGTLCWCFSILYWFNIYFQSIYF